MVHNISRRGAVGEARQTVNLLLRLSRFESYRRDNKDLKLKWYKLLPVKQKTIGSSPIRSARHNVGLPVVVTSRVSRPRVSSKKQQLGSL